MKTYTFHTGPTDTHARYIFNNAKHRNLQSKEGWKCMYVQNEKGSLAAFLWINISGNIAHAPLRAPFGSFEADANLSPRVLYDFIAYVIDSLKTDGVTKIVVKNPPDIYNLSASALLNTLLLNQGFTIMDAEVSSVIPVSTAPYADLITEWEHRKLRQATASEFSFQQHDSPHLESIYSFIESCRQEKEYTLSMSLPELKQLQTTFADQVMLFAVSKESVLAAACIAIQVSDDVLYTFYYDHTKAFDTYSPVVKLVEGMYHYCQVQQIHLLDLGTAALNRQPNFPLLSFKMNIGGIPSAKLTFVKELS